jgi:hypothetical protein
MILWVAAILIHLMSSMYVDENTQPNKETKRKQKVIIIADPGVDDAAAILMAVAHPDIDVLAVLSNFGTPPSCADFHTRCHLISVCLY